MKPGEFRDVVFDRYRTRFARLEKNLFSLKRIHEWPPHSREIDTFVSSWHLMVATSQDIEVFYHRKGRQTQIVLPAVVAIPPYSIIDWRFSGGVLVWDALGGEGATPPGFPKDAGWAPWNGNELPQDSVGLAEFLRGISKFEPIAKLERASLIAERTKKFIDGHFSEPLQISDLAERLKIPYSTMVLAFKRAYDLTPVVYRNRLRLFHAIGKIVIEDQSIAQAGYAVGFQDLARFNKQFKKFFLGPPKKLKKYLN